MRLTCNKGKGVIGRQGVASQALRPLVHVCQVIFLQHAAKGCVQLSNGCHQLQACLQCQQSATVVATADLSSDGHQAPIQLRQDQARSCWVHGYAVWACVMRYSRLEHTRRDSNHISAFLSTE